MTEAPRNYRLKAEPGTVKVTGHKARGEKRGGKGEGSEPRVSCQIRWP
jgi:hypothetical protein